MSTMGFDKLKLLAIFNIVVEQKSFAGAARILMSSRSRVSEQVSKLEQMLGVRLLQRSTRRLELTDEGSQVYEEAMKLSQVINQVEAIVSPNVPSGRVTISVNHDIAHKFLLKELTKFYQLFPNIQIDLELHDKAQDLIMEHIDLAIRIGKPKDSNLIARTMHKDKFAIYASPEFIKHHGEPETLSQLEQLRWITLGPVTQNNSVQLVLNNQPIEIRPKSFSRCNSPYMVQEMVRAGLGVSILLPTTVENEVNKGELIQLLPDIRSEDLDFSLVYPSRRQLPTRTRAVIDYLLQAQIFSTA